MTLALEPSSWTRFCVVGRLPGLGSLELCLHLWLHLGPWGARLSLSLRLSPELLYEDVFAVWEVIWAARHISSEHFVLFIALALVEAYREIVRDNNMDFTDVIRFFNGRSCPSHPGCPQWEHGGPHSWPGQGWKGSRPWKQVEQQGGWPQGSSQTPVPVPATVQLCVCPPERAEHHDAQEILQIARELVHKVQMLIENK